MKTERYMIDNCGTLIDKNTNTYYYYMEEILPILNQQENKIKELEKENMEYYKLINCRKCKYHNYDSYANGDDFEICEKGNNERLIYHYFCNEFEK